MPSVVWRSAYGLALLIAGALQVVQAADPPPGLDNPPAAPPMFSGVGLALASRKTEAGYQIMKLIPNSPAALSCEIQVGDVVMAVGDADSFPYDIDLNDLNFENVIQLIRGPVDSEVRLRIVPKDPSFVKEKVIALKRQILFGAGLMGQNLVLPFTSLDDRKPLTVDQFAGRAVVLVFWSVNNLDQLPHLQQMIHGLDNRKAFPTELELIAVNCDATIEQAETTLQQHRLEQVRQTWIDPKTIESLSSGVLPLIVVVAPTGEVEAVCHPESINLEKFLKRYSAKTDAAK